MSGNVYVYILVMAAVTYLIRMLPLTLIRGRIKSTFIKSFLYYVPYVTLAVMTFPSIIQPTMSPLSGTVALAVGIVAAWRRMGLFPVAAICCAIVYLMDSVIM